MVKSRFIAPLWFLATIAIGAILLAMPPSNASGQWMNWSDALFTSCSAVCITGLTVIDPGTALTQLGQTILILLVQVGCAGIMTIGTFILVVVVGRKMSLADEFSISDAYGRTGVRGLRGLIAWIVCSQLAIEAIGAAGFYFTLPESFGTGRARIFSSIFYSIGSFCHAGFSLRPDSLASFSVSPAAIFVSSALILVGGLGFMALYNLCTIQFWRRNLLKRGRISLHTRVVLRMTAYLTAIAFVLFWFCESGDGGALERFTSLPGRLSAALFHAVTPRTAGFTVIPMEDLHPATRFIDTILMFIGAGPGSAGGGIKMTTFFVFVCTLAAIYHGHRDVTVHKRSLPLDVVREATVITLLYAAAIAICATILLMTENGRIAPGRILFETVSAITTTGLSTADTTKLVSCPGRIVLCLAMFAGRMGALSIVLMIAGREDPDSIRYPRENIVVG